MTKIEMRIEDALRVGIHDTYDWHQKMWNCFPKRPDAKRDFLTRFDLLEGGWCSWMVSESRPQKPDWCLEDSFFVKEITSPFFDHRFYFFDLLANPVKSLVQRDKQGRPLLKTNGKRRSGKRVPIIKEDELKEWILKKADGSGSNGDHDAGFRIVLDRPLEISPMQKMYFRKKGVSGYHGGVRFQGTLEVTHHDNFIKTYKSGIGGAKAFGFGLLLLAPVGL